MSETSAFTGFSEDGLHFLRDLEAHNDRAWFQPRKADFERLLKEPLIFDGRNVYDLQTMHEHGFTYYSIGRPVVAPPL